MLWCNPRATEFFERKPYYESAGSVRHHVTPCTGCEIDTWWSLRGLPYGHPIILLKSLGNSLEYFNGTFGSRLTHWGRVTHICVSKLIIIGSYNGLSPGRRQAIICTNSGILLIGTLGTNFSEILIKSRKFSFKKMGLKVSSAKWRPFCLGLNVLTRSSITQWCIQHEGNKYRT